MSDLLAEFSRGCVAWSVDLDGRRRLKVALPDTNVSFWFSKGRGVFIDELCLRCHWAETEYELRIGSRKPSVNSAQGKLAAEASGGYRHFARIDEIAQFYQYVTGNLDSRTPFQILWIQDPQDPDRCAYGWEHAITWRYPLLRVVHSHFIKPTERTARTLITMRCHLLLRPRIRFDGDKIRVPKLVA
jgi:hypothetical protein